jgi:hypothetical protein
VIERTGAAGRGAAARSPRSGRRPLAPELVAALLATAVVIAIGGGVLAAGAPAPITSPEPSDAHGQGSSATPTPGLEDPAIATCLEINGRLEADRAALGAELTASVFEPGNVATILRSINADLIPAQIAAERLQHLAGSALVGARLATFYGDLQKQISAALANSVNNAPAYKAAAIATRTALADLAALDALLEGLRTAGSTPSASPASASPSAPRPSAAGASGSPVPSSGPSDTPAASPSGESPVVVNALVNPGFESGVGPPWELALTAPGSATLSADPTVHSGGAASARVDVTVAGDERAAVALRQGGLPIEAGGHYVASISVRAASTREIRIRIASATGDTYATRLYTVGPEWQVLTVDSTVFATDANAYLEVDLGRFAVTTWLDDASFGQIPATGG